MSRLISYQGIDIGMTMADVTALPRRNMRYLAQTPVETDKDRRGSVVMWRYVDDVRLTFKMRCRKNDSNSLLVMRVTNIEVDGAG